jgi:hypothetical protein
LFEHLWEVELTYRYIFSFKFTLKSQQLDIVPIILPPVSLTPVANLPPVSLTPLANSPLVSKTQAKLVAKFAAGVVDTGGVP